MNANWSSPSPISNQVAGETFGALPPKKSRMGDTLGGSYKAVKPLLQEKAREGGQQHPLRIVEKQRWWVVALCEGL
jgi:hypothetical protein